MDYIAFDLETTGTVAGVDRIVEIGAVKFVDGEVVGLFSTLVNPQMAMPAAASAVNGITDEMLQGRPLIGDLLQSLTEFCGEAILVAHNANFDAQFLIADYKRIEIATPRGVILDTLPMARKIFPGLPNHRLSTVVQHLNIPASQYHRAEDDATLCGRVLEQIVQKIAVDNQAPKIENLIALTGKPAFYFPVIERQPKQLDLLSML
ncbi:MAG: DNA polymerase III subunit epsilon [Bdellovibrio sp.]|nr:MAG: DNA polymerase III subunit epsilon [Bdellovibrio sp.]